MARLLLIAVSIIWLVAEHGSAIWQTPSRHAYLLGTALLLLLAASFRVWPLVVMAMFFVLARMMPPHLPRELWMIPGAGMTVLFAMTVIMVAPFATGRRALSWFRLGSVDRVAWILCAVTSSLAAVALLMWAHWTDNLGFGVQMMRPLTAVAPWLVLMFIIPGIALLNAFAEEVVYRGLVQHALTETFTGLPVAVWVCQATVFAALHVAAGFPNGAMGYAMVLIWGTMLGYLRHRTRGMLAPFLVHVAADLVIFYTLYVLA